MVNFNAQLLQHVSLKFKVCGAQGIYFFSNFVYLVLQLPLEGAKTNKTSRWHMPGHVISSKNSLYQLTGSSPERTASEISNFVSLCVNIMIFFLCSKQLDSQRFSLWFSQVALGSWDIEGQQIFLVLRRATWLFNIQLLHHMFMLMYNGSIPGLEHLPWGLDCNCFGHPVLEIFLLRASLTLSFRCGGDKKRKIKKSCSAACCCTENAFPLISQTSNRALPLPVNPFHHRPP